jgi:hypothetical protein
VVSVRMVLAIFHLSGSLRGRSLNAFSVGPAARSSRIKIPFRFVLCGIPHEHCRLIVLPLISPNNRSRNPGSQNTTPFSRWTGGIIPPESSLRSSERIPLAPSAPGVPGIAGVPLRYPLSQKEGMPFPRAPISGVSAGCKDTPRSGCSSDSPAGFCCFFHRLFQPGRDSSEGSQARFPDTRKACLLEALLHQLVSPCIARRKRCPLRP